jgi:hypothetical protein
MAGAAILPVGQPAKTIEVFRPTSQACPAKISLFPNGRNYDLTKPSRPHEGRFAIVTIRGAGCDGRGRDARRAAQSRTVKPCGPVPSTLGSSCAERFAQRRWLKSPTHRGERGVSRKAIAQGVPDVFGFTCLSCVHSTPFSTQACGCGQRPAFPAPSLLRGTRTTHHSDASAPRDCEGVSACCLTAKPDL